MIALRQSMTNSAICAAQNALISRRSCLNQRGFLWRVRFTYIESARMMLGLISATKKSKFKTFQRNRALDVRITSFRDCVYL